jgi:hypothetical protein
MKHSSHVSSNSPWSSWLQEGKLIRSAILARLLSDADAQLLHAVYSFIGCGYVSSLCFSILEQGSHDDLLETDEISMCCTVSGRSYSLCAIPVRGYIRQLRYFADRRNISFRRFCRSPRLFARSVSALKPNLDDVQCQIADWYRSLYGRYVSVGFQVTMTMSLSADVVFRASLSMVDRWFFDTVSVQSLHHVHHAAFDMPTYGYPDSRSCPWFSSCDSSMTYSSRSRCASCYGVSSLWPLSSTFLLYLSLTSVILLLTST